MIAGFYFPCITLLLSAIRNFIIILVSIFPQGLNPKPFLSVITQKGFTTTPSS